MSIGASAATRLKPDGSVEAPREIDVEGRWDALALSELLIPFRSFLSAPSLSSRRLSAESCTPARRAATASRLQMRCA